MVSEISSTLDAAGNVIDFSYDVWSNTHSTRPESAGNTMVGWLVSQPFAQPAPQPIPQPAGGGDRNAIPLYKFPSAKVTHLFIPQMPVRVSALRALGDYMNVFSIESFMDELAAAPDLFTAIECDERRRLIEEALGSLPHEQREVVIMKLWGNLSFAQIGEALSVPANTAASRYRYALEKLRHPLAQEPTT